MLIPVDISMFQMKGDVCICFELLQSRHGQAVISDPQEFYSGTVHAWLSGKDYVISPRQGTALGCRMQEKPVKVVDEKFYTMS